MKGNCMANNSRTHALTGSASGIGRATKELLESRGHRVIGVDLRNADVIADLGTRAGRDVMIKAVTKHSGGTVDALLAVAGVDLAGLDLPDRVVMAPLTRSRAPNDIADEMTALYYTQRATATTLSNKSDKNIRDLDKGVQKMFDHFPPGASK
jgi:nucleoside-diphosphate-sugar epimerase